MKYSTLNPVVVDDNILRKRKVISHQQSEPVDGMELDYVLADNVHQWP